MNQHQNIISHKHDMVTLEFGAITIHRLSDVGNAYHYNKQLKPRTVAYNNVKQQDSQQSSRTIEHLRTGI